MSDRGYGAWTRTVGEPVVWSLIYVSKSLESAGNAVWKDTYPLAGMPEDEYAQ